jgi:hypothetical protein
MAIVYRTPSVIVCGPDAYGSAVIGGRTYRWDFHHYCGPTFLRKDGEMLKHQPGEHHPVWQHFNEWLQKRSAQPVGEKS